jgi:hypothetical protein
MTYEVLTAGKNLNSGLLDFDKNGSKGPASSILGAFAKLRKATISFVLSVRPSVRMEQLGSHWTDFHEI